MPSPLGPLDGRSFAAVVFDMDGTLIDSTSVVVRSWVRWAQEHDVDPRRLRGFHGVPAAAIVAELLPRHRHDAAVARITELELADTDGIEVLPGAAEALAALAPDHSAIATSCTAPLAAARIEASGLVAPRVMVTADDVERGKPHPDPFLLAAQRLGVDPAQCLVVEDAPGGLAAARSAGCATLAVVTTTARDELVGAADAVVTDLSHVAFTRSAVGVLVSPA
ncbi:HAD-IA family hydrolase [Knoellia sp. 3-2P3]|uniref:HAD-IA family hydrolase n=1 Tax=unclassified Knoellia TaxID=2618719 RepID=UPI0023DBEBF2|nr:HAD-IA family hydrolase [Knoellia sp. 3-2P3]MDF2091421.1 HAD-IA family hydrolase [Knoellia sp. 3-2P3]